MSNTGTGTVRFQLDFNYKTAVLQARPEGPLLDEIGETGCAPCVYSGHWAALDTTSHDLSCISETTTSGQGQGNSTFKCFLRWEQDN